MTIAKYNGNWTGYLEYTISTVSQQTVSNTSKVRVDLWIGMSGGSIQYNTTTNVTITVDGQRKVVNVGNLNLNNSKKSLGYVEFTLSHDSQGDGSWTFNFSSNMTSVAYQHLNWGSVNTNFTYTAKKINRLSSVTVSGDTYIDSYMNISISRSDSSYLHKIRYEFNGLEADIASDIATSYRWRIPSSFASAMPNTKTGSGVIFVDTYSETTLLGTSQATFTVTIPEDSLLPTLNDLVLSDYNQITQALIPESNYFLKILSNIKVSFSGTSASNGATIVGYYAEIVNTTKTVTSDGGAFGILLEAGDITIRGRVQDSRGLWSKYVTKTITIVDYHPPVLSITANRYGANNDTLVVMRTVQISPLTINGQNRNSGTLWFRVAPSNSESYGNEINKISVTNLNDSPANLIGSFASNSAWKVKGFVTDRLTTTPVTAISHVSTEKVVYYYDEGGFAVGKIREAYTFEANGSANLYNNGRYHANGLPIQHHQITEDDGQALYKTNINLDDIETSGFYFVKAPLVNAPGGSTSGYLTVINSQNDGDNFYQQYVSTDTADPKIYHRLKKSDGSYFSNPWIEMTGGGEGTSQPAPTPQTNQLIGKIGLLPFGGLIINFSRKGDVVTISVDRQIKNFTLNDEYKAYTQYKVSYGYRPTNEVILELRANVNTTMKNSIYVHIAKDGTYRVTGNTTGSTVYYGSVTFCTGDSYPS